MIINQWVPAAHDGDAIGDSARRVRDMLRAMGHTSDLYALTIDDSLRDDVRPFDDAGAARGDATIFHYALPSPMTEPFAQLSGRRILQYHNITPAHFFAPYEPGLFRLAVLGRRELATLAGRVDYALGDSDYNRRELEELGFAETGVLPIAVDTARMGRLPAQPALTRLLDDGLTNILFVGRLAPNKKIEDHLRLAEVYKRYVDADYRFIFVGRYDAVPRYFTMIRALATEFKMPSDRFWFTGARTGRRSGNLLPHRRRLRLTERARGFLRAAAGGDGRRRSGPGVCRHGRTRDVGGRRRAVRTEGPRICRRVAGPAGVR